MTNDRPSFSRASAKAFGSRLTHPALVPATLSWVMGCRPEPRIGRYPGRRPGRNACLSSNPPRPATFGTAVRLAEVDAAHQPSRIDDDDLQHQNGTPTTRSHAAARRKRPYAFRIDVDSGPEQPEAVCKDLRDPAYPHPRTGHRGASSGRVGGVWHDPRGQGRDFYWLGTSSTGPGLITTAGAQLRAAILRDGALARASVYLSTPAWEKG